MSYTYAQYGTGFNLIQPTPEAQNFNELLQLRGTPATIIHRTQTGTNPYGNPTYTETTHQTRCLRKTTIFERNHPAGNLPTIKDTLLLTAWEAITPDCELELDGDRYHIKGITQTPALTHTEVIRKQ